MALPERVRCEHCGNATPGETATQCEHCGAPLEVLAPLVLQCGWCSASNHRRKVDQCTRCGAPLPALPGGDPGPRPPATPRKLPEGYRARVLLWNNIPVSIGLSFLAIGVFFPIFSGEWWMSLFAAIGLPLAATGSVRAARWLRALTYGQPTRGVLTRVQRDRSQQKNGVHPWRIEYEYDVRPESRDGERDKREDFCEAWDPSHKRRQPGDHVWVVYRRRGSSFASAIWPPLR